MKIKTIFFAFFLTLMNSAVIIAQGGGPGVPGGPPLNPPTSDINQNIVFLLVSALFFGIYTIYKYNLKRKASI